MLVDTHVHLNARQFKDDREETIQRAFDAGVSHMVVVGFDHETIPLAIEIAEQYDTIYAAVGWHPVDAIDMTDKELVWIEELAAHPKVVAIGEMGLDYHWDKSPKDVQADVFRGFIRYGLQRNSTCRLSSIIGKQQKISFKSLRRKKRIRLEESCIVTITLLNISSAVWI